MNDMNKNTITCLHLFSINCINLWSALSPANMTSILVCKDVGMCTFDLRFVFYRWKRSSRAKIATKDSNNSMKQVRLAENLNHSHLIVWHVVYFVMCIMHVWSCEHYYYVCVWVCEPSRAGFNSFQTLDVCRPIKTRECTKCWAIQFLFYWGYRCCECWTC